MYGPIFCSIVYVISVYHPVVCLCNQQSTDMYNKLWTVLTVDRQLIHELQHINSWQSRNQGQGLGFRTPSLEFNPKIKLNNFKSNTFETYTTYTCDNKTRVNKKVYLQIDKGYLIVKRKKLRKTKCIAHIIPTIYNLLDLVEF